MKQIKNIGSILKKIRQGKGYTQAYVSKGILSRSYLALIESNYHMPSLDIILKLLDRLNVGLDEFTFLLYQESDDIEISLKFTRIKEFIEYSESEYKKFQQELNQLYQETKNEKYYHLSILLKAHRQFNKQEDLEKIRKVVKPVKQYLIQLDSWFIYDFRLFNNTLFCFSGEEIISMFSIILKYIEKYSAFFQEKLGIMSFFSNFCTLLVIEKRFLEAIVYANKGYEIALENSHLTHAIFLESIIFYCKIKLSENKKLYQKKLAENLFFSEKFHCQWIADFFVNLDQQNAKYVPLKNKNLGVTDG